MGCHKLAVVPGRGFFGLANRQMRGNISPDLRLGNQDFYRSPIPIRHISSEARGLPVGVAFPGLNVMKTKRIDAPRLWKSMSAHPLSELIEFGKGISIEEMAKHMKEHGYDQEEAIVLFEDMILDGRHRREACKIAGIIPPFREFVGKNPFAYVAKKIFRQHPSVAERAKIAATLADLPVGRPEKVTDGTINSPAPMTTAEAAKAVGVSKRSVQRAKAGKTERKPRKPKSEKTGQAVMDWKDWFNHFGSLVRAVVRVAKAYDIADCQAAKSLESKLAIFKAEFTRWVEFHTKEKAPSH